MFTCVVCIIVYITLRALNDTYDYYNSSKHLFTHSYMYISAMHAHTHMHTHTLSHTHKHARKRAHTVHPHTHAHTHTRLRTYIIHTVLSSRRPGSQNRATCHERDSAAALLGSPCPPLSHAFRHCICCDGTSISRPFWPSCARTGDLNPKPQTLISYTRFGMEKKKKRERKMSILTVPIWKRDQLGGSPKRLVSV